MSIGGAPKWFVERNRALYEPAIGTRKIHRITHYSPRCNGYFRKFETQNAREFEAFDSRVRSSYKEFIREHDEFGADPFKISKGDLERIFRWQREMESIRSG